MLNLTKLGLLLLMVTACTSREATESPEATAEVALVPAPNFVADSAYRYIEQQVAFGPRVPGTAAHRACQEFLVEKLTGFGADVQVQSFEAEAYDGAQLPLRNIMARLYPDQPKRILLAAHWDTRPVADQDSVRTDEPIDGANDGASGVGVLLELARALHQADTVPSVGIDILLFDGEDYGEPDAYRQATAESSQKTWWCLGSQYWATHKVPENYSAYYGILLDMVGAKDATFYQEGVSRRVAPSVVERVWQVGEALGYGAYFVNKDSPEIIDDHVYVSYDGKIPMIDIIEYEPANDAYFGHYWHTHADSMNIISRETLQAVGETVMQVIYREI